MRLQAEAVLWLQGLQGSLSASAAPMHAIIGCFEASLQAVYSVEVQQ